MSEHPPETSVVIRALNEERWLPDVLKMLERQRYRDFEVLLVDSGSVDRTRDLAAAAGARIVRLRSEDFTFGHALNVGIREARGSFIAILSAHAIPVDEEWRRLRSRRCAGPTRRWSMAGKIGHALSKILRGARLRAPVPAAASHGRPRGALRQQRELRGQALALGATFVRRGIARPRGHRLGQTLAEKRLFSRVRAQSLHHSCTWKHGLR